MPGRLNRLFTFARAGDRDALENFTTEALAAAIEEDLRPLLRALPAAVGVASPIGVVELLSVHTPMQVDGGIVDLAMEVVVDGVIRSFWIEVKAHAGLSGWQIEVYCKAASGWHTEPKPAMQREQPYLCKHDGKAVDRLLAGYKVFLAVELGEISVAQRL